MVVILPIEDTQKEVVKKPHIPFLLNLLFLLTKTQCFNCESAFDEESIIFLKMQVKLNLTQILKREGAKKARKEK